MSRKKPSLQGALTAGLKPPRLPDGLAREPAPRPSVQSEDPRPFAGGADRSRRSVLVELAAIGGGWRLRLEINHDKVAEIADSMATLGLQSPILVGLDPDDPGLYPLIAGAHRLEAAHLLGWTSIEAFVIDRTAEERLLIEIDENYARAELTPLDRGRFAAKRKALYAALHGDPRGGNRKSATGPKIKSEKISRLNFLEDTARQTGLTPRAVQRAVKIGVGIPDGLAAALAATPIAGREGDLYAIAGMTPAEQRGLAAGLATCTKRPATLKALTASMDPAPQAAQSRPKPAAAEKPPADEAGAPEDATAPRRLKQAWMAAGPAERRDFIAWLSGRGDLPGARRGRKNRAG